MTGEENQGKQTIQYSVALTNLLLKLTLTRNREQRGGEERRGEDLSLLGISLTLTAFTRS